MKVFAIQLFSACRRIYLSFVYHATMCHFLFMYKVEEGISLPKRVSVPVLVSYPALVPFSSSQSFESYLASMTPLCSTSFLKS
jgi:hypothetical protein